MNNNENKEDSNIGEKIVETIETGADVIDAFEIVGDVISGIGEVIGGLLS